MDKKKLVPELRFEGFIDDWKEFRLDELAKIERGRFSPRPRNNPIYYGGSIPFVQTGDVVHSSGIVDTYSQTLNEKGLKVSKLFPKGTILITIAANIGYAGILSEDMACPDSLIGIKCKKEALNTFLNILFHLHQPKMDYLAVAAAQKNINIEFLKPYKLIVPGLIEQQKIANFLTAIDKSITLLKQKKAALEQYKKGLMQKIFNQEIRFVDDEGNDFVGWVEVELGSIGEFKNGINKGKNDFGFGVPFVNLMDVFGKTVLIKQEFGLVNATENEIKQYELLEGDVLFIRSSVKRSGVGETIVITENLNKTVYSGFLIRFRDENYISKEFKKYCFWDIKFRNQLVSLSTSSANTNINQESLKILKISLPCKREQQKIADCLTSMDQSINKLKNQIEQTTQFKKGLLQKMFV